MGRRNGQQNKMFGEWNLLRCVERGPQRSLNGKYCTFVRLDWNLDCTLLFKDLTFTEPIGSLYCFNSPDLHHLYEQEWNSYSGFKVSEVLPTRYGTKQIRIRTVTHSVSYISACCASSIILFANSCDLSVNCQISCKHHQKLNRLITVRQRDLTLNIRDLMIKEAQLTI
jgi:hypothetical protein